MLALGVESDAVVGRLRYNKAAWVAIERLEQHWVRSSVDARIVDPPGGVTLGQPPSASTVLEIETANVAALTITPKQVDLKTVPVVVRPISACTHGGEGPLQAYVTLASLWENSLWLDDLRCWVF